MLLLSQLNASHGRDSLTLGHDSELKRPREVAGVLSRFMNTGKPRGTRFWARFWLSHGVPHVLAQAQG